MSVKILVNSKNCKQHAVYLMLPSEHLQKVFQLLSLLSFQTLLYVYL